MKTLAVFAPELGASFVDFHLRDIAPGRTVAIAHNSAHQMFGHTQAPCPTLYLDRWAQYLPVRLLRRTGLSELTLRNIAVSNFLRKHRVEVVLGEFLNSFVSFVPLLEEMRLPYVVQGHGIDVSAYMRDEGTRNSYLLYQSAKAILTRSELHRQRLIELGLPADKVQVNHGGVNVPAHAACRAPESACRFLAIGGMYAKKGPIFLLEAFRRAQLARSELTLDYIGGGPLFDAARQFVEASQMQGCVRLHGFASENLKKKLLERCGVFVQHSITADNGDEEGLPAAIQEAMAAGQMVISTRHSGIPEAVVEGTTGRLVEEKDVAGMAYAMMNAPEEAERFGRRGHAYACTTHAWCHEQHRLRSWLFE